MSLLRLNLMSDSSSLLGLEQAKLESARLTSLAICLSTSALFIQALLIDVPLLLEAGCIVAIISNYIAFRSINSDNIQVVMRSLLVFLSTLLLVLTVSYPSVFIGIYLAPLLLQAIYSENNPRWRIALLGLIALCFYTSLSLSNQTTPFWFNSSYDYQSVVEINCIISGLTCALIAGINRDLNLHVNRAAKRHGQRLEEQVETVETARNELKIVSEQLLHSKKDLDDQLVIEEQNQTRLNQAHEQLEQFSLAASHDLKEPIRTIRLYTQLVQKRLPAELKTDVSLQEHFQFITNSCKHMYAALEKLLVYQKASYSEEEIVELSAKKLCHQQLLLAATEFRTSWKDEKIANDIRITYLNQFIQSKAEKLIAIKNSTDEQVDMIRMTRSNAEVLFYEIAQNALLFRTWDREIQIELETSITQSNTLQLTISDNGIGIGEPYLEQVFGMFKRIHQRESFPGTGLGLPIARRIVSLANGTISMTSSKGQGTSVIIKLPRSPSGDLT